MDEIGKLEEQLRQATQEYDDAYTELKPALDRLVEMYKRLAELNQEIRRLHRQARQEREEQARQEAALEAKKRLQETNRITLAEAIELGSGKINDFLWFSSTGKEIKFFHLSCAVQAPEKPNVEGLPLDEARKILSTWHDATRQQVYEEYGRTHSYSILDSGIFVVGLSDFAGIKKANYRQKDVLVTYVETRRSARLSLDKIFGIPNN